MNVSTFKPLKQQVNSNDKYTDVGYIPCNGYVPCKVFSKTLNKGQYNIDVKVAGRASFKNCLYFQTDQMSPNMVEERMEGADPCHDYNEGGPGPEGCW